MKPLRITVIEESVDATSGVSIFRIEGGIKDGTLFKIHSVTIQSVGIPNSDNQCQVTINYDLDMIRGEYCPEIQSLADQLVQDMINDSAELNQHSGAPDRDQVH